MSAIDEVMAAQREAMVREVEESAREHIGRRPLSPRALAALRAVPRHLFVPPQHLGNAYRNRPLPIGYRQTISQPLIVALMTDLLGLGPDDRVLEIGTGSGYQTAVLARLAEAVYTIEICAPLAERAARTFVELGLSNVHTRVGDGYLGWPEAAPFDAILVAAAPPEIPRSLLEQLKPGGRLVIPVGSGSQQLIVVEMRSDQSTVLREIIPVCFVPMTRQNDRPDES
ncbi:protein-L-isoaspartate(D-aspartate) O-methyltransferase [Hyphomicrobium sp. CS1GBMeth3]|uniref:protein-L-isoaspartate(D-aspartate) O-methyltransferase n=1 Tax=Hyphomicrobium sp. CS1GBMeth3 TaxID=1892845 RepID=UPI000930432C|nr:protein-L-isoaspartate(D-aspartate) O-methyltransferase [Hyphomicrobium sp. CS1GBMeth3]